MHSLGEATVNHMNKEAPLTDEGDLSTGKSHVKHHIMRPRGLLRQAWEDVSYDLAPQAADN